MARPNLFENPHTNSHLPFTHTNQRAPHHQLPPTTTMTTMATMATIHPCFPHCHPPKTGTVATPPMRPQAATHAPQTHPHAPMVPWGRTLPFRGRGSRQIIVYAPQQHQQHLLQKWHLRHTTINNKQIGATPSVIDGLPPFFFYPPPPGNADTFTVDDTGVGLLERHRILVNILTIPTAATAATTAAATTTNYRNRNRNNNTTNNKYKNTTETT